MSLAQSGGAATKDLSAKYAKERKRLRSQTSGFVLASFDVFGGSFLYVAKTSHTFRLLTGGTGIVGHAGVLP